MVVLRSTPSKSAGAGTPVKVERVVFGVTGTIALFVPTGLRPLQIRLFRLDGCATDVEFDTQVDPMSCVWRLRATRAMTGVER
jgi:hypothetical protein